MSVIKSSQSNPLPALEEVYYLAVTVVSAKDLKKGDVIGSNDPYVKVVVEKQTYQTKTIPKSDHPIWNEDCSFVTFKAAKEIKFEVYDEDDNSKNDFLGSATADPSKLYGMQKAEELELAVNKGGTIQVKIQGRTVKPLELENRCKELQDECQKQEAEIQRKQQEVQTLMSQNGAHATTKMECDQEAQKLQNEINNIKQQIEKTKQDNKSKEETLQNLKTENQNIENQINSVNQQITTKQNELKEEKKQLKQQKDRYESAYKEKESLNEANQDYE